LALELHAGQHDPGGQEVPERQWSEDGQWWWDGADWQPAESHQNAAATVAVAFEAGQLSEDGQWQWDGQNWLAAPAEARQGKTRSKDKVVNGVKLKPGVCNHPDVAANVL